MSPDKDKMFPKIAVRAIIRNATGEVLILKRANTAYGNGLWNLPGGKIDFNQTATDAVIREVSEETSLLCDHNRFLFYMDNLPSDKTDLHFVTLFFECHCKGNVLINNESCDYRWINANSMKAFELAFGHDIALIRYFSEY